MANETLSTSRAATVEELQLLSIAIATAASALRERVAADDERSAKHIERVVAHAQRLRELLDHLSTD